MGDCRMHKQTDNGIIHRNTPHPEPYIPPFLTSLRHPLIKLRGIITRFLPDILKINNNKPEQEAGGMSVANEAELKFKEWLDSKDYPYLYIEQSTDTFATFFRNTDVKRPDFLILVKGLGLIAVDVKSRELRQEHETFILDEERDISKLIAFERVFRIPVWLAISNEAFAYRTWFWITLSEIVEKVDKLPSSRDGREFRAIPIKMCKTVGWNDSIGDIFQI